MNENPQLQIERQKIQMEIIKEIGFMGYRFLITLNSGAFIVLLTFLGNIDGSTAFSMDLIRLKYAMSFFLTAIGGTFISMMIAYISAQRGLLGKAMPGGSGEIGHISWLLLPVIISFVCFCIGSFFAVSGISGK